MGDPCCLAATAACCSLGRLFECGHRLEQGAAGKGKGSTRLERLACSSSSRRTRTGWAVQSWRWDQDEEEIENLSFDEGVDMFNKGDYYKCHDVFEGLWNDAAEPQRTLLHALVQVSVALYHLSNRNYRGAMVELGEGTAKLARLKLKGELHHFEEGMKAVLDFLYKTQVQNAGVRLDGTAVASSDEPHCSYQLLANFGAGRDLYRLDLAHGLLNFVPETGRVIRLPRLVVSQHELDMLGSG